ncbi:MAG: HAD family hydrolase [Planctomycetes bacterium]|nr:HAD family hydrolase [Planctomycetota bacterium]MCB9905365.1 HAD family hydrolase [Planctomycetota bacterium]
MSPHAAAPLRLAVWSGPRNLSTALMRSFENRSDTIVVDEPLYAHYLAETGRDHPMRAEVIAAGERDWRRVSERLTGPLAPGVRCFYQKHMAHHLLPHVERAWLDALTHVFLIRDPRAVLASLHAKWPNPGLADTGLPQQVELFERTWSATGEAPPVVDSTELLSDPHAVLGMLCARVGLEFEDSMLEWPAGKRESDGVWAAHWYADVERSTGFGPPRTSRTKLPRSLEPLAEACEALHSRLFPHRIRAHAADL